MRSTDSARKIGRLIFWLMTSVIFMALSTIGMVSFTFMITRNGGLTTERALDEYYVFHLFLCASRVGISASQVRSVGPVSATGRLAKRCLQIILRRRTDQVTPSVERATPTEAPDGPPMSSLRSKRLLSTGLESGSLVTGKKYRSPLSIVEDGSIGRGLFSRARCADAPPKALEAQLPVPVVSAHEIEEVECFFDYWRSR